MEREREREREEEDEGGGVCSVCIRRTIYLL